MKALTSLPLLECSGADYHLAKMYETKYMELQILLDEKDKALNETYKVCEGVCAVDILRACISNTLRKSTFVMQTRRLQRTVYGANHRAGQLGSGCKLILDNVHGCVVIV
jgi:hypothetical protein